MPWPEDHESKEERFQFRMKATLKQDLKDLCKAEGFDNPSAWLNSLASDGVKAAKERKRKRRKQRS